MPDPWLRAIVVNLLVALVRHSIHTSTKLAGSPVMRHGTAEWWESVERAAKGRLSRMFSSAPLCDLSADELMCVGIVATGVHATRGDLESFLGPYLGTRVEPLVDRGFLRSRGPAIRLGPATSLPRVVEAVAPGSDVHGEFMSLLRTWTEVLVEQSRHLDAIRVIPWLVPCNVHDEPSVEVLLRDGGELAWVAPRVVHAAAVHVMKVHPEPLCPALRLVSGYAAYAVGRREQALTSLAALASDLRAPVPCGHQVDEIRARTFELWFARHTAAPPGGDVLVPARSLLDRALPGQRSTAARGQVALATEVFFQQCHLHDLTAARSTLAGVVELVGRAPDLADVALVHTLAGFLSCIGGRLRQARAHADAARRVAPDHRDPRLEATLEVIVACCDVLGGDRSVSVQSISSVVGEDPLAAAIMTVLRPLAMSSNGMLDHARSAAETWFTVRPARTSLGRTLQLSTLADLAWIDGDRAFLESIHGRLAAEGVGAEIAILEERLRIGGGRRRPENGPALPVRQNPLPFTELRALATVAEGWWIQGDRRRASEALDTLIDASQRRACVMFASDMLRRQSDWAASLRETRGDECRELPVWLVAPPTGQDGLVSRPQDAVDPTRDLTFAETKVLAEIARGLTAADAADRLHLSPHTVRTHLKSVYRKLGVRSRVEAVDRGRLLGYV